LTPEATALFALSGDEFRNAVLRNALALSGEVPRIPEESRERLAETVRGAWPEDGVGRNIERSGNTITFLSQGAMAWLTLAPELDLAPTPEQWADIATCGAVLTDTTSWLRTHYTEEAALLAAATCTASDARPWADLISAIPTEAPPEVVDAAVRHVTVSTEEHDFDLRRLAAGFVTAGRLDALQTISVKSEAFEAILRTYRAELGEVGSARILIEQLVAGIEAGKFGELRTEPGLRPRRTTTGVGARAAYSEHDTEWLHGVSSPDLLPDLFRALRVAALLDEDIPTIGHRLVRAISRIGGEDAVDRYDDLIEASEDSRYKFLRSQRDEIAQQELRKAGQELAPSVASELGVPVLDT
jgi:hypothetical protein